MEYTVSYAQARPTGYNAAKHPKRQQSKHLENFVNGLHARRQTQGTHQSSNLKVSLHPRL